MSGWQTQDIPRQDGKTAVITGANSGIGYYTALERTLFVGEVDDASMKVWQTNIDRHEFGMKLLEAGATCAEITPLMRLRPRSSLRFRMLRPSQSRRLRQNADGVLSLLRQTMRKKIC